MGGVPRPQSVAGPPRGRERLSVWAGFGAGCHGRSSWPAAREDGTGTRLEPASRAGSRGVAAALGSLDKVAGHLPGVGTPPRQARISRRRVEAPEALHGLALVLFLPRSRHIRNQGGRLPGSEIRPRRGGRGDRAHLAFLSFYAEGGKPNQLVADICARGGRGFPFSSGGGPGGAIEHRVPAGRGCRPSSPRGLGPCPAPRQEEATAFEPFENLSRKFDGAETEEVRRCLDDYGLQERAVSTASVFVHLSGRGLGKGFAGTAGQGGSGGGGGGLSSGRDDDGLDSAKDDDFPPP